MGIQMKYLVCALNLIFKGTNVLKFPYSYSIRKLYVFIYFGVFYCFVYSIFVASGPFCLLRGKIAPKYHNVQIIVVMSCINCYLQYSDGGR
jgi:hypothetical protein